MFCALLLNILSAYAEPIHDVSRIETVNVEQIAHVQDVEAMRALVLRANKEDKKIAMAGARHSQGGHIYYPDGLVLDMRRFNRILGMDHRSRIITVESGITWGEIQDYANKYGLAIRVMQASNIFTVGGSMSVNAHGRDPRFGSIVDTIKSFRLLNAQGQIKNVSRTENPELFQLVIGGFGLFGVILDVDIWLTDNEIYKKTTKVIPWTDYPSYFDKHIKDNKKIGLHFAWPSISPRHFMEEILVADYTVIKSEDKNLYQLKEESFIPMNRFMLSFSRRSKTGKAIRWFLQKNFLGFQGIITSRNNAMRPEVKFLDYQSKKNTDILQEYFFPADRYEEFMSGFKKIVKEENINILSMTLRYVPAAQEPFLRYAGSEDRFAAVVYINHGLTPPEVQRATQWTRRFVDLVISVGGQHYLAYQRYPTQEQVRRAYPQIPTFFNKKKKFDPKEIFSNQFYEYYN